MNILCDFVNVRIWDVESVESLYRKYSIAHTLAGEKNGRELSCFTKHLPGMRFYFEESEEWKAVKATFESIGEANRICAPGDEGYSRLWDVLRQSQREYRDFLDECVRGHLDLSFINSRLQPTEYTTKTSWGEQKQEIQRISRVLFAPASSPWAPRIDLELRCPDSLEAWIDAYALIFPLMRGEGEAFSRVKRCLQCRDYFFAKSQKALFCSDVCRKSYHNEKRSVKNTTPEWL